MWLFFCCLLRNLKFLIINIIIALLTVLMYFINNLYLKENSLGIINYLSICYINDFLCPIFLFSYSNILLYFIHIKLVALFPILAICAISSIIWEFCAPLIKPSSVTDLYDILSYLIGALFYYAIINCIIKK